jgi:hypothetical protein
MSSLFSIPLLKSLRTFSFSELFLYVKENRTLSLGIFLGFVVLTATRYITSPYRKLPPGPRGYPIIGNVLELRESQQWLKFTEWRKQYGRRCFDCSYRTFHLSYLLHQVILYTSMLLASPWSSSILRRLPPTYLIDVRGYTQIDLAILSRLTS